MNIGQPYRGQVAAAAGTVLGPESKVLSGKSVSGLAGYNVGYVFFTHYDGSLVSSGVEYFERWDDLDKIPVSHTGIVTGENECVESHWGPGVNAQPLTKYLDDPRAKIYFRRPRGWTPALGGRIAAAAMAKVGCKYDRGLIFSQLASSTILGHWLNQWLKGWPDRFVCSRLDRKQRFICSELAAFALAEQPELKGVGCLKWPLSTISPQELFEDREVFENPQASNLKLQGDE